MNTETPSPSVPVSPEERPHAERSSSQLGNLTLCPGFRPDKKAKVHWVTEQGVRGHEALDTGDTGELDSSFEERLVQMCNDYVGTLPPAMREEREMKIDTIEGRWGYIDLLRFRAENLEPDGLLRRQAPTVADLVDWKFVKAAEVTDAEINLQGKDYVVGLFMRYPHLQTIHVHFVMPRFGSVTTATFHRSQIDELKLEILAVLIQAKRTDRPRYKGATLRPHFDTCRFCGVRWNCKALTRIATKIAIAYDPENEGALPEVPEQLHASEVTDEETLGRLRKLASVMAPWAAAVYHHTTQAALDGHVPEGYSLDYRKGKRALVNPAGLLQVAREFDLSNDEILDAAEVSFSKLEETLKAKAEHGQKSKRVAAFLARCQDLDVFERAEDSPTLTRV
jgi:hypothetical protein